MTIRQLQLLIEAAERGSITEAAEIMYVSQPSLTFAIHSLEKEFNITIFNRSNRGVELTKEGEEFVGLARQIVEQAQLIEERYNKRSTRKKSFCVSSQHYSFVVEAFVALLREEGGDRYKFHLRETTTYDVIEDVAQLRSQLGVLYLNKFNENVLQKTFRDEGLVFEELFVAQPHVFVGKDSPLSKLDKVRLEDLKPFPRLSYEQGIHNSFYFSEEIMSVLDCDKEILVCDRASLFNMLVGMNGYTICSGVISEALNGDNVVARPLLVDDYMRIGAITPSTVRPSRLANRYLDILRQLTQNAAATKKDGADDKKER